MGIQNKSSKDKRGKNNVSVNINITETTPPKVVKIPTKVVKVPTRATPRAQAKRLRKASDTDALSARPVENLQELASEFSRVKDLAQSRGVPIPPSYSQFSDIRDRASLQTNTELLQERIRQLNKSIASGGVAPPEGNPEGNAIADEGEVIPFVDPVQQPQVPQPSNMFDQPDTGEIQQLTEEMESMQIIENLKARIKDGNLSIEQKLQFASDARLAIQNLLDNLIARNASDSRLSRRPS